jgi:hypothetical protein
MGRKKRAEADDLVTISYRVSSSVMQQIEAACELHGVTRSDVLRELLQRVNRPQINDVIRAIKLRQLEISGNWSISELKSKRAIAEKQIAWIDSELKSRLDKLDDIEHLDPL